MFRHIGMYLNFAVNIFTATIILEFFIGNRSMAFGITLLLMACCIGVIFSPLGTRVLRIQYNLQDPNEIEQNRIDPIFQHVYKKALSKTPDLPNDIVWYIHDDDSINAFAIGLHTIGINIGMLRYCQDDEIAAVLAHEFAHIAHRDALATSLSIQSNYLALLGKAITIQILKIVGVGLSLLFRYISEDEFLGVLINLSIKFSCWVFDIYTSIVFMVCLMISYASCRQQEYDADKYAAELGFKESLIHIFERLPATPAISFTTDIIQMLYNSHPKTEDRIQRLKTHLKIT